MDTVRPIPTPPPPPAEPPPPRGTKEWAAWTLKYSFSPDDAAIIDHIVTLGNLNWGAHTRAYVEACHARKWAGWQATLVWTVVETLIDPIEDDIPF